MGNDRNPPSNRLRRFGRRFFDALFLALPSALLALVAHRIICTVLVVVFFVLFCAFVFILLLLLVVFVCSFRHFSYCSSLYVFSVVLRLIICFLGKSRFDFFENGVECEFVASFYVFDLLS